jgi:hypothetical protein
VPLVDEAVAIFATLPWDVPPFELSENGMLNLLQKHMHQPYTVHGFRSASAIGRTRRRTSPTM